MPDSSLRVLRLNDVLHRTGLRRASVYRLMSAGEFPRPIKLGERTNGWLCSEIDDWIRQRIRASRGAAA